MLFPNILSQSYSMNMVNHSGISASASGFCKVIQPELFLTTEGFKSLEVKPSILTKMIGLLSIN